MYYFMCMDVFCLDVYLYTHAYLVPMEANEGVGSSRTRVIHVGELLCRCWEKDLDPLEKQPVLLIELSLQAPTSSKLTLKSNLD